MPTKAVNDTLRIALLSTGILAAGCATFPETAPEAQADLGPKPTIEVIPASAVNWGALNPARGDQGPRAADLWGDRTGSGATGLLVRFAERFSSPPHIHNTTYRGVVIEGLIHNDDPDAAEFWMPTGSYWNQPAGEVHITAAKGDGGLVFIEIQHGPYLVLPADEASDTGERAINIHASNMVWLDASSAARLDQPAGIASENGPMISYLWGDPQNESPSASVVRLPAGFVGTLRGNGPSLRVVVVEGRARFEQASDRDTVTLDPGSYIGSHSGMTHQIQLSAEEECVLYVRTEGTLEVIPSQSR